MLDALRLSPLFTDATDRELALVAATATARHLAAGDRLFEADAPCDDLFVIVGGHLEVFAVAGGSEQTLAVFGAGAPLGTHSVYSASTHGVTARAASPSDVLVLSGPRLRAVLDAEPALAVKVLRKTGQVIATRLRFNATSVPLFPPGVRREHDLLGERDVPEDALFGVQTLRATENFDISRSRLSQFPALIRALAQVKQACARANLQLGLLDADIAGAIDVACEELGAGRWHGHFVVDMVQGGAGTSTNMNANEVIANRALERLGHARGDYDRCHPNNHVNLSQSTNDVYPSALRLAALEDLDALLEALQGLRDALEAKGEEFGDVLKMARTQLQDAVPMTLGQEFRAFAVTIGEDIDRLRQTSALFLELNLGGTAVGTGINTTPGYRQAAIEALQQITGRPVVLAADLIEATPDTGDFLMFSGVLKRAAVKLSKLCNDLRLLSSGPRCGFGEITLPPMQPGSSIMPGKVNPVIPEVVNQVAFRVVGNDLTITMAAEAGQLQLNVMEPIIALSLFESMSLLRAAVVTLTERCVRGISADAARCRAMVENSIGIVTATVPYLGYERAGEVAREALTSGRSVRTILLEAGDLDEATLDEVLSVQAMTAPRALT